MARCQPIRILGKNTSSRDFAEVDNNPITYSYEDRNALDDEHKTENYASFGKSFEYGLQMSCLMVSVVTIHEWGRSH